MILNYLFTKISYDDIIVEQNTYIYDGMEKNPKVNIEINEIILTENVDYTIEYSNNINAGTASIVIQGIGNYTGNITKTFDIAKKNSGAPFEINSEIIAI